MEIGLEFRLCCSLGGRQLVSFLFCWIPCFSFVKTAHCCLVAKSCQTLYDLVDCSPPGLPVLHYLSKFAQTQVHWSVVPSHHLVLCFLLLLTYSSRERENQETRWHKSGDFAPVAPRRKAVKIEVKVSSPSAFFQEASSSVLHSKSNEELSNNLYSSSTKEPSDPQF